MIGWFKKLFSKSDNIADVTDIQVDGEKPKDKRVPWISLNATFDEGTGKMKVNADWNDAFVKTLKAHYGYSGNDDEAIVQLFIANMHHQNLDKGLEQDDHYV